MILFLLACSMAVAAFSQGSGPFDAALERTDLLDSLEGPVQLGLAEMQLQEAQYIFSQAYGLPERNALNRISDAEEFISTELDQLEQEGRISGAGYEFAGDLSPGVADFETLRADHRDLFDEVLFAIEDGDDEYVFDMLDELELDNLALNDSLRSLVLEVEHDRLAALEAFPDALSASILGVVLAMLATLVLALLGYWVIADMVSPLRHIDDMMMSIRGDLYKKGNFDHLQKAAGSAGRLARALDQLAEVEHRRTEAARAQITAVREELYQSRRRRLKLFGTPGQGKEA
jgi:hypothetical protein